jgi:hypothetical protein
MRPRFEIGPPLMPYAQLHCGMRYHEKVLALSDHAFRIWAVALEYCQERLTDGRIPRAALAAFGFKVRPAGIAELLAARLWEAAGDGWQVHDYLQWNRSRSEILEQKSRQNARADRYRHRAFVRGGIDEFVRDCEEDAARVTRDVTRESRVSHVTDPIRSDPIRSKSAPGGAISQESGRGDGGTVDVAAWIADLKEADLFRAIARIVAAARAHEGDGADLKEAVKVACAQAGLPCDPDLLRKALDSEAAKARIRGGR